ncbi:MAG: hypothetical protein HYS12_29470 [Planctomycetes bacterium]|nr:hypothetical protein [Planctomycetota bacterium]
MRRLGLCGALLLTAAFASPAHGQVGLAWKWTKDGEFYVRTETKVKQTLVIEDPRNDVPAPRVRNTSNDREVRQGFSHIAYLHYQVLDVHEDGSAKLRQQVVKELRVAKDPFDKKEDDPPKNDDLLGPQGNKPGAKLILHVKPSGEVTKVEGQNELLTLLAGSDTGKRQAIQEALSEESLKKTLSESLGFLPVAKVKPGATWKRTAELNLGPLGRARVEHDYAYEGKGEGEDKNLDRIVRTTRLVRFKGFDKPALSFRVSEGHFTVAEGKKGTFFFDAEKGRLVRASTEMKLEGKLTILNATTTYRIRLVQKQSTSTTVMDKLPAK